MTPSNKTIVTILAGVAMVVAILVTVSRQGASSGKPSSRETAAAQAKAVPSRSRPETASEPLVKPRAISGLPKPQESPHARDSAEQAAWVAGRIEELDVLSSRSDPDSLNAILAELGNSDPGIRAAAVAAARSSGNREAIPWLEKVSGNTVDSGEKKALDDAIEYLRLPTVIELLESNPDGEAVIGDEPD